MKKITLLVLLFIFISNISYSQFYQNDNLSLKANVDFYYQANNGDRYSNYLNFTSPIKDKLRIYNTSLTGIFLDENVRGKLSIQYGDINPSSSSEYIREAAAGFSPVENLWLDAGFFYQLFSAERLLPSENFLTSVPIQSGFEPVRQEAAKVTYDFLDNLSASFIIANGYQMGGNVYKNKSFGLSINYSPFKNFNIGVNNLTGNVRWFYLESNEPYLDTRPQNVLRIFNNINLSYKYNRFEFLSGIDFIVQSNSTLYTSDKNAPVFATFVSAKYNINEKFNVAARGEYVWDRHAIFSFPAYFFPLNELFTGMETNGFAFGVEYRPRKQLYARLEMNYLNVRQDLGIPASDKFTKLTGIASMGIDF